MTIQAKRTSTPELGLNAANIEGVAAILNRLLADEQVLYHRLRNYHWNVVGIHFHSLHELFQMQYEELTVDIDEIAERIRQLGVTVRATMSEYVQMATIHEQPGEHPDAEQMLRNLTADHEAIIRNLRTDLRAADEQYDDMGTSDFLTALMEKHEKSAWMLRAHFENRG